MTHPDTNAVAPSTRPSWTARLDDWLAEHVDELIALRRQIHAHPELGFREHATTAMVEERLTVAGLAPRLLSVGTGVMCDIEPGDADGPGRLRGPAPRVALRADLDALPMTDEKDVPYRSRIPGVSHACGHDVHTTVVLGAGLFLARHRSLLPGSVRLLFQPAEEVVPGGAVELLRDGALDDVGLVLGLHCEPKLAVGRVGLRTGAITSAADLLEIRLTGPGGHTARPHETVDLVRVAADVVQRLPEMVQAGVRDHGSALIVFGSLHTGDAGNVIPTTAVLRGSVRTQSPAVWERIGPVIEKAVADIAGVHGAEHHVDHQAGVPPVVNDARVIERVAAAVGQALEPGAAAEAPQSWGGDDFAHLTQQVPGAYLRLGVQGPAQAAAPLDLHAGHFDVDEDAIAVGIRTLVGSVLVAP